MERNLKRQRGVKENENEYISSSSSSSFSNKKIKKSDLDNNDKEYEYDGEDEEEYIKEEKYREFYYTDEYEKNIFDFSFVKKENFGIIIKEMKKRINLQHDNRKIKLKNKKEKQNDLYLQLYFKEIYINCLKVHLKKRYELLIRENSQILDQFKYIKELENHILKLENKIINMNENIINTNND